MNIVLQVSERAACLFRAATERAEHIPTQIEQAGTRGPQTKLKRCATRYAPIVGERVGTQAREREVVCLFDCFDEPRDEFGLRALCDELLAHLREPFAPARREPRIGCCYTCGRLVRRRHLVVTTHDRIEPAGADQADLERDDDQPNW